MSTDEIKEKKPKVDESTEQPDEKKVVHRVEISRQPEIDSLQAELQKTRTELEASKKLSVDEKKVLEDEKKRIEDELKEKRAILEAQALKQLEEERNSIMELAKKSKLSDEQISDIEKKLEDPKSVGIVKDLITMLASSTKETPPEKKKEIPSGKAPITPPPSGEAGEGFETKQAMVDELYRRAYYFPNQYTKEQVEDAKKKIETLLRSMIGGKSWKQMQEGERLPAFKMMECPKCRGTIVGEVPEKCPYCHFNFTKTGDRSRGEG